MAKKIEGLEPDDLVHLKPEKAVMPEGVKRDIEMVIDNRFEGKIVKIGDPADVNDWIKAQKAKGRRTSTVTGGDVMPGLHDAHEHPMMFATLEAIIKPTFVYGMGREQAIEAIKRAVAESDGNVPFIALGFDATVGFDQSELKEIVGNREAAIFDPSFHGCLVTPQMAEAIRKLVTDQKTPGYIDASGHATEEYALRALEVAESRHSIEGISEAVERKLEHHLFQGVTSLHDMVPNTMNQLIATLIARKKWKDERGMEFPVTQFHLRPTQLRELGNRLDEFERMGLLSADEIPELFGLKLLADGSLGSHTAKMKEPFEGGKGRGIWFNDLDQINEGLEVAREHGINKVAMHAIGDEGIDRALETAKKWVKMGEKGDLQPKFRIEHFELPLPQEETLAKTKEIGAWVCPQPNFLLDYVYKDRLGERVRWICPHKAILEHGIPMMFGTDGAAGGTDSMLYAIYLATHSTEAHQRLSFEEAILASTFAAAHYEGDNRGQLKEGMKADIIVADPALLAKLAPGEPDVSQERMSQTIADLDSSVWAVYKSGKLAEKLAK